MKLLDKLLELPSHAELVERLDYDPDTGELRWKVRPLTSFKNKRLGNSWNAQWAGKVAGHVNEGGYIVVGMHDRLYSAHRVIWKLVHGVEPTFMDHKNHDPRDNRLVNLRECNLSQNAQNARGKSKGKRVSRLGLKGVSQYGRRFQARITIGDKQRNLGMFSTAEEAHAAYILAARNHFGEFACYA